MGFIVAISLQTPQVWCNLIYMAGCFFLLESLVCLYDPAVSWPCMKKQTNRMLAPCEGSSSVPVFCYPVWIYLTCVHNTEIQMEAWHKNRNGHKDQHYMWTLHIDIATSGPINICICLKCLLKRESNDGVTGPPFSMQTEVFLYSFHAFWTYKVVGVCQVHFRVKVHIQRQALN